MPHLQKYYDNSLENLGNCKAHSSGMAHAGHRLPQRHHVCTRHIPPKAAFASHSPADSQKPQHQPSRRSSRKGRYNRPIRNSHGPSPLNSRHGRPQTPSPDLPRPRSRRDARPEFPPMGNWPSRNTFSTPKISSKAGKHAEEPRSAVQIGKLSSSLNPRVQRNGSSTTSSTTPARSMICPNPNPRN